MAKPENPFFAKALVNRLWGHFFGRGLVHEVDDMRETNPPSNPELLDALAKDFIEHKFDVKHVHPHDRQQPGLSALVASRREHNRHDRQNFARYYARRLIAEVLLDAVDQATRHARRSFSNMAPTARAVDLPHEGFGSYFLDTFDRPRRVTGCECERSQRRDAGAGAAPGQLRRDREQDRRRRTAGSPSCCKDEKPIAGDRSKSCTSAVVSRRPTDAETNGGSQFVEVAGRADERSRRWKMCCGRC